MLAVIAGVMLLTFAACITDSDIEGNTDNNTAPSSPSTPSTPSTPAAPTPIELNFDHPARYQVVPAWVEQGKNTIAVTVTEGEEEGEDESGEESVLVKYLPVIYAERTPANNVYVVYLGQIDNVPIGDLDLKASYNGVTPVTVTYQKSAVKTDKITESITRAAKTTVVTSEGKIKSDKFSTSFFYANIGGTLDIGGYDVNTFSSLIEEISFMESVETVKEWVDGKEGEVSYPVGYHNEPAGRYRIALFATTDVYVSVQMRPDNSAMVSEPEITTCVRKSTITAELDYDENLYGDFPRTGGGGMLTVPDLENFTALTPPPGTPWFVVAGSGNTAESGNGNALFSVNGKSWSAKNIGNTRATWNSVVYGNGSWVAVGDTFPDPSESNSGSYVNIARSSDGYNWTTSLVGNASYYSTATNWSSVTYVNNSFVIAGSSWRWGTTSQEPGITKWRKGDDLGRSSTNSGSTWSNSNYGLLGSTTDFTFYDKNWADKQWAAVNGTAVIALSTDFKVWSSKTVGADPWISVTAGNSRDGAKQFVAAGNAGGIAYWNFKEMAWTKYTVGDSNYKRVYYNGEKFVAVGSAGKYGNMAYSYDGDKNWHTLNVGPSTWEDVTYGNGLWVAVGGYTVGNGTKYGQIATSTDGITWAIDTTITGRYLNGITFTLLPKAPW